jgi:hypothetical protein
LAVAFLRDLQRRSNLADILTTSSEYAELRRRARRALLEGVSSDLFREEVELSLKRDDHLEDVAEEKEGLEDPRMSLMLEELAARVDAALRTWEDYGQSPVVGVTSTGRAHAATIWLHGNSVPIILFDYDMFLLCHLAAKVFASCFGCHGR